MFSPINRLRTSTTACVTLQSIPTSTVNAIDNTPQFAQKFPEIQVEVSWEKLFENNFSLLSTKFFLARKDANFNVVRESINIMKSASGMFPVCAFPLAQPAAFGLYWCRWESCNPKKKIQGAVHESNPLNQSWSRGMVSFFQYGFRLYTHPNLQKAQPSNWY